MSSQDIKLETCIYNLPWTKSILVMLDLLKLTLT